MSTSARMLQLLSLLQTHRYWPGDDLAARLEVSPRTLRRDVERLRDLGYPVDADRGVGGGYQLAPGAALPPLVVTDDEAVAIAVGLHAAAQGTVAGTEEAAVRALAKLVPVMPRALRRRVDALRAMTVPAVSEAPSVDADDLTLVAQACRDAEALRFTYTAAGGDRSEREVEPHRLVSLGRRWYLVAHDRTRHDWRSFRLDRVADARRTGARLRPRDLPADDAAAFVRAGIERPLGPHVVRALVHAPADVVRARFGRWGSVEEVGHDRCRVTVPTDTFDRPAEALGSLEVDFEVDGPPEFAAYLREWSRRFRRAGQSLNE